MAGGQHGRREIELHDEVRDWYESLDEHVQERVTEVVELLIEQGERLRMPHSRSLGEGLLELRISPRRAAPHHLLVRATPSDSAADHLPQAAPGRAAEVDRARQAQRDCETGHHPDEQED